MAILPYLALLLAWRMFIRFLHVDGLGALRLSHVVHALAFGALALRHRRENAAGLAHHAPIVLMVVVLEVLTHLILEWNRTTLGAGVLVGMLSGMAVPYVMAFSRALLQKSYNRMTWAGATLVSVGIACSIPLPTGASASIGLALLSTSALLLPGLGLVLKEMLLKGRPRRRLRGDGEKPAQTLDIFSVAAVSSIGQLLGNLIHGAIVGERIFATSAWTVASGSLLEYVAASGVVRLAIVMALGKTSALSVQIANAMAVPIGGVFFLAPYISPRLSFGLLTALVGVGACVAAPVQMPRAKLTSRLQEKATEAEEEVELARRILAGLREREEAERTANLAAWAAQEAALRAAAEAAEEAAQKAREAAEAEEDRVNRAVAAEKRVKVAGDAGKATAGAVVAVTSTVAAGATLAAGIAVAAGAVVTAGAVVATGLVAGRIPSDDKTKSSKPSE